MTHLTLQTDRTLVRSSAASTRYLLATVTATVAARTPERPPLDVAFVIDRSGSMGGDKIVLAREAVLEGVGMLRDTDRFSVVSFDDHIDVVVPVTTATHEAKREAEQRVRMIDARGSTNLGDGWHTGCRELLEGRRGERLSRCLLLSDGQANCGVTEPSELARLAAEMRGRGIVTSTLGVGADFDEQLMTGMAQAGGGHGYFIRDTRQIGDLLTNVIGEALEVVASDAAIVLTLPAGVEVEVIGDFALAREGDSVRVALGDLVSGQQLQVVLRLRIAAGPIKEPVAVDARLADRDDALGSARATVAWTRASGEACKAQPRDRGVDVAVARQFAAKARHEALEWNRAGDYARAREVLQRVATRIGKYAGDCRELRELGAELRRQAEEFARHLDAMSRKAYHYDSLAAMSSRQASGKARRTLFDGELLPLALVGGVPVFTCGGRRVVLDTGSPVSFGHGPLPLLGRDHDLPSAFGPVSMDDISRAVGAPVDALVGADILAKYQWLVDVGEGRLVVSRGEVPCDGVTLRTPSVGGVPTADVILGGRQGRAVLDTGARLSYAGAADVSGTPVGRERDFNPLLGVFETDVYRVRVEIAGLSVDARVGVMPPALQQVLALVGARWIVGMDVLGQAAFVLDLGHGRMKLVTGRVWEMLAGV
jgi:Ca-activated chloride channel homolog